MLSNNEKKSLLNKMKKDLKEHPWKILEIIQLQAKTKEFNKIFRKEPRLINFLSRNAAYWAFNPKSYTIDFKPSNLNEIINDYESIIDSKWPKGLKNFMIQHFNSWHNDGKNLSLQINQDFKRELIRMWSNFQHIKNLKDSNKDNAKNNNDNNDDIDTLIKKLKSSNNNNNTDDNNGLTQTRRRRPHNSREPEL